LIPDAQWKKLGTSYYSKQINESLTDGALSQSEKNALKLFEEVFGLDEGDKKSYDKEAYKKALEIAYMDGEVAESEEVKLVDLENCLGLQENDAAELRAEAALQRYQETLDRITKDQRISPEEEQELLDLANKLNVDPTTVKRDLETYSMMKIAWGIENGELPVLKTKAVWRKNEVCHWFLSGSYLENKKVSLGYSGGRSGVSIKVAKGVRFRVGGHRGKMQYQTKTIRHRGTLYVTNKRVFFKSDTKSFQIFHGALLNYEVFSNGIIFQKEKTAFKVATKDTTNTEIFGLIMDRVLTRT
jgi:hypothetical protein